MSPEWLYTVVFFAWLAGAAMFVIGLHQMNSPATARGGNRVSALGMTIAVGTTLLYLVGRPEGLPTAAWIIIVVGFLIGGGFGLYAARNVAMTAMPQLVSVFNAVGGGAAALVAIDDYLRITNQGQATVDETIFVVLGAVIGSVTFTGSVIAAGKLQGLISGKPIMIPAGRLVTVALAAGAVASTGALVWGARQAGGASTWPPVIFGGIIAGALGGAAGGILTKLMADAMNRSIMNIVAGGFGGGEGTVGALTETGGSVRAVTPDDVAIQLAYASRVIIVPRYGLAVAQ